MTGRTSRRAGSHSDDDRFRRARQERLTLETPEGPVEIDLTESPLRWLASRRDASGRPFLHDHEVEAGERFRRDVTLAGWCRSSASPGRRRSRAAVAARPIRRWCWRPASGSMWRSPPWGRISPRCCWMSAAS